MACTSLVALPRACGAAGISGGFNTLYMISYVDLAPTTGTAGEPVYTTATNGIVSAIGTITGKNFVAVGLLQDSAGFGESGTFNLQNGSGFITQTLNFPISGLTVENRNFVKSVMNQPIAVLIKTASNNFYVAGLEGRLQLSGLEGGTGTAPGDLQGYTLTFTGISQDLIPMVDPTIVAGLIS